MKKLRAKITRCSAHKPLVVIDSQPFNGMELRSADIRLLAAALEELANLAEAKDSSKKGFKPIIYEASWETP